ncbi:hypothetical protein [Herbaspirillum rubrisubalbicans]|uniref:hypothetical protein n=1 Tax=Herbaspirillum rubrisubalbicans TaxID=80842 RepID=UPI0003611101|nr:hypothetical protein [Herbaspirillum rubrisubalbicans]
MQASAADAVLFFATQRENQDIGKTAAAVADERVARGPYEGKRQAWNAHKKTAGKSRR